MGGWAFGIGPTNPGWSGYSDPTKNPFPPPPAGGDQPIEYDPWGQAIVSGVGDLAKFGVETGVEWRTEGAEHVATHFVEHATHEAVGYGVSTGIVEPKVDAVVDKVTEPAQEEGDQKE
jgi:hypothetical protein